MSTPGAEHVETVRGLLAEILERPAAEIRVDADLIDELDVDSLQRLELMTLVGRELGVRLDVDDWRDARTVAELAARVDGKLDVG